MAAGGFKTFVAGETLDENDINDFLMQGMLVFSGSAARGSAITAPVEGQFSFLTSTDKIEYYDGSAWVELETAPSNPIATGGNGTVTSGGYNYHVFSSNGDFVVTDDGLVDVILIGGGGGGGGGASDSRSAGGGGAGFIDLLEGVYVAPGTVAVTVGAGGGTVAANSWGNMGSKTSFGEFSTPGGGGGGSSEIRGRQGGNSGGSGAGDNGVMAPGTLPGYGNNGGAGGTLNQSGGGGGGNGSAGTNGSGSTGGNGGAGSTTYASWFTTINSVMAGAWQVATSNGSVIAGGGAGSGNSVYGTAGTGGGGAAGLAGSAATPNTGSGGGGARTTSGGAGASGLVVVRYLT